MNIQATANLQSRIESPVGSTPTTRQSRFFLFLLSLVGFLVNSDGKNSILFHASFRGTEETKSDTHHTLSAVDGMRRNLQIGGYEQYVSCIYSLDLNPNFNRESATLGLNSLVTAASVLPTSELPISWYTYEPVKTVSDWKALCRDRGADTTWSSLSSALLYFKTASTSPLSRNPGQYSSFEDALKTGNADLAQSIIMAAYSITRQPTSLPTTTPPSLSPVESPVNIDQSNRIEKLEKLVQNLISQFANYSSVIDLTKKSIFDLQFVLNVMNSSNAQAIHDESASRIAFSTEISGELSTLRNETTQIDARLTTQATAAGKKMVQLAHELTSVNTSMNDRLFDLKRTLSEQLVLLQQNVSMINDRITQESGTRQEVDQILYDELWSNHDDITYQIAQLRETSTTIVEGMTQISGQLLGLTKEVDRLKQEAKTDDTKTDTNNLAFWIAVASLGLAFVNTIYFCIYHNKVTLTSALAQNVNRIDDEPFQIELAEA